MLAQLLKIMDACLRTRETTIRNNELLQKNFHCCFWHHILYQLHFKNFDANLFTSYVHMSYLYICQASIE